MQITAIQAHAGVDAEWRRGDYHRDFTIRVTVTGRVSEPLREVHNAEIEFSPRDGGFGKPVDRLDDPVVGWLTELGPVARFWVWCSPEEVGGLMTMLAGGWVKYARIDFTRPRYNWAKVGRVSLSTRRENLTPIDEFEIYLSPANPEDPSPLRFIDTEAAP